MIYTQPFLLIVTSLCMCVFENMCVCDGVCGKKNFACVWCACEYVHDIACIRWYRNLLLTLWSPHKQVVYYLCTEPSGIQESTQCMSPSPPDNGFIAGSDFREGARVHVLCEEGYVLAGPSELTCIACTFCSSGGIWSPEEKYSCKREWGNRSIYPSGHPILLATLPHSFAQQDSGAERLIFIIFFHHRKPVDHSNKCWFCLYFVALLINYIPPKCVSVKSINVL